MEPPGTAPGSDPLITSAFMSIVPKDIQDICGPQGDLKSQRHATLILLFMGGPRVYSDPMTDSLPPCPECSSEFTYEVDSLFNCPECGHEWTAAGGDESGGEIRDSVGNLLADGDTVTVIKDLKLKGSSTVVKVGTKVRGIRLVPGDHDIDCKVPGIGQIGLKSQFVKKVTE